MQNQETRPKRPKNDSLIQNSYKSIKLLDKVLNDQNPVEKSLFKTIYTGLWSLLHLHNWGIAVGDKKLIEPPLPTKKEVVGGGLWVDFHIKQPRESGVYYIHLYSEAMDHWYKLISQYNATEKSWTGWSPGARWEWIDNSKYTIYWLEDYIEL